MATTKRKILYFDIKNKILFDVMDFEFYRNFITVAETGNLTAAANKLSLAQPALSNQIKTLERHYGVKLMETSRGRHNISLTEAGVDFLTKARLICEQEENITIDMQNYKQETNGKLRFAVSYGVVPIFLKNYLQPFSKLYPKINFQLLEIPANEQITAIRNNTADFAYANAPMPNMENCTCKKLDWENFYVVYKKKNNINFQPKQTLHLTDLKNIPISTTYGCYTLLRELCKKYNFVPKIAFISNNGNTGIQFAENGNSVAIASNSCCQFLPPQLEKVLIKDKDFKFEQTLFWSNLHGQNNAAKLFLKFIGE
ncbi:MAG: LysR family transcriptional regulator [Acidaminococcaceae bacterium]|nr:LysR family transcriptional regulator [Acidaminococcaceae bacterium]